MGFLESLRQLIVAITTVVITTSPIKPSVVISQPVLHATPSSGLVFSTPSPIPTQSGPIKSGPTPPQPISRPVNPSKELKPTTNLPLNGENYIYVRGSYSYFGQSIEYLTIIPRRGGGFSGNIKGACSAPFGGTYQGGEGGEISGIASGECNLPFVHYKGSVHFKGHLYPEKKTLEVQIDNSPFGIITLNYN